MLKTTAVNQPITTNDSLLQSKDSHSGYLLITQQDKIIYANRQARHYLGLLADEKGPIRQTFLSLVQATYRCYPTNAWLSWLKTSSATTARYLVYSPPHSHDVFQLKVEILEQLIIDSLPIWIVSIVSVHSPNRFSTISS